MHGKLLVLQHCSNLHFIIQFQHTSMLEKIADESFAGSLSAPCACGYDSFTMLRSLRSFSSPVAAILPVELASRFEEFEILWCCMYSGRGRGSGADMTRKAL